MRGIHCLSRQIPHWTQTSKILHAILCNSNFMLPTSAILGAAWLSVNHLKCDPLRTGAKLCKGKFHILWHTYSLLKPITEPQPVALASEYTNELGHVYAKHYLLLILIRFSKNTILPDSNRRGETLYPNGHHTRWTWRNGLPLFYQYYQSQDQLR